MVRDLLTLVHARSVGVTLPDRLKLAWHMLLAWLETFELRLIDRRLARRGEERTPKLLAFDEIPALYDLADFPFAAEAPDLPRFTEEPTGWSGNVTPEVLAYQESQLSSAQWKSAPAPRCIAATPAPRTCRRCSWQSARSVMAQHAPAPDTLSGLSVVFASCAWAAGSAPGSHSCGDSQ